MQNYKLDKVGLKMFLIIQDQDFQCMQWSISVLYFRTLKLYEIKLSVLYFTIADILNSAIKGMGVC